MISPIHPSTFPPIHPLTGLHPSSTVLGHSCSLCSCILLPASPPACSWLPLCNCTLLLLFNHFSSLHTSHLWQRHIFVSVFISFHFHISQSSFPSFHLRIRSSTQHKKNPMHTHYLANNYFVMQLKIKNGKWIQKTRNTVLVFISSRENLNILSPAPSSRSSKRNFRGQSMFRVYQGLKWENNASVGERSWVKIASIPFLSLLCDSVNRVFALEWSFYSIILLFLFTDFVCKEASKIFCPKEFNIDAQK